jgi:EmrB/QacA subfamily drug resistance transporter
MTQSPPINRPVIMTILILGGFVVVLNQTLLPVAIPTLMVEFSISASLAQWVTTAFLLANGIVIPISATLIDRYPNKVLFIIALLIFLLGTVLAAFAPNFSTLIIGRVIQGISAGLVMPIGQTAIMSLYPPHKRGAAMGLVGMVIAFAPAIGPSYSGWLIEQQSWRWIFLSLVPITLIVLGLAVRFMQSVGEPQESYLDWRSVTLSSLGWGGLLFGVSVGGSMGWTHPNTIGSLAVGVLALSVFIPMQLRLPTPMLEFRVFQAIDFRRTTILSILVFALMITTQNLIPLYVQSVRGMGALQTGLLLLPGAILMGIMSPISGRLFDRFGVRWLAVIGFSLMTTALILLSLLTAESPLSRVMLAFAIHMLGISTLMMPLMTAGINALPRRLIAQGTAVNNTLRMIGGSIFTALMVSISTMVTYMHSGSDESALLRGLTVTFTIAACCAFLGVLSAFRLRHLQPASDWSLAVTPNAETKKSDLPNRSDRLTRDSQNQ